MDFPVIENDAERVAEVVRRKTIIAIEAMSQTLSHRSLTRRQQSLFSTGRKLARQGNVAAAFTTLRRLCVPIDTAEIDALIATYDQRGRS